MSTKRGTKVSKTAKTSRTARKTAPAERMAEPQPAKRPLEEALAEAGLEPSSLDILLAWLSGELCQDQYAALEQAQDSSEKGIPLAKTFVDLDISLRPGWEGEHIPKEKTAPLVRSLLNKGERFFRQHAQRSWPHRPGDIMTQRFELERRDELGGASRLESRSMRGIALVGGPGQGKSTLCQFIVQIYRAALLEPYRDRLDESTLKTLKILGQGVADSGFTKGARKLSASSPNPEDLRFPLPIVLRELAAFLRKRPKMGAIDFVWAKMQQILAHRKLSEGQNFTVKHLAQWLSKSRCLLVLDGLDEVPVSAGRDIVLQSVRALLAQWQGGEDAVWILGTTRPQGYGHEWSDLALSEHNLLPLSPERVADYVKRLVEARYPDAPARKQKVIERIAQASQEEATARLLKTPLQVTLMATLVERLGRVSSERWSLFRDYYRVIYEREIERNTPASEILRTHRGHIDKIHSRVALLLQAEGEEMEGASALMSKERLLAVVDTVLLEDDIEPEERDMLGRKMVEAAVDRLVFLVQPREEVYGYEIRSLQEFMAAWEVLNAKDDILEQRCLYLGGIAYYRNICLFIASKAFGELSDLRDILVDKVIPGLNDHPTDETARTLQAGSILARDMLKEGAMGNQPKYARALAKEAVKLLEGRPRAYDVFRNWELRGADEEIRDALAMHLQRVGTESSRDAWLFAMDQAMDGEAWAIDLCERFWPTNKAAQAEILEQIDLHEGKWIERKIVDGGLELGPLLLNFADPGSKGIYALAPWLEAAREQTSRYYNNHSWMQPTLIIDDLVLGRLWGGTSVWVSREERKQIGMLAKIQCDVRVWAPQLAAWRFDAKPSAPNLALQLDFLADYFDELKGSGPELRVSWPLQACLAYCDSSQALKELAKRAKAGDLGDIEDWRKAEKRWINKGVNLDEIVAMEDDALPFAKSIADQGIPLCFNLLRPVHKPTGGQRLLNAFRRTVQSSIPAKRKDTKSWMVFTLISLAQMAEWIDESVSFSLSIEMLDRLIADHPANTRLLRFLKDIEQPSSLPVSFIDRLKACAREAPDDLIDGLSSLLQQNPRGAWPRWIEGFLLELLHQHQLSNPGQPFNGIHVLFECYQRRTGELHLPEIWKRLKFPQPYPQDFQSAPDSPQPLPASPQLAHIHISDLGPIRSLSLDLSPRSDGLGQWTLFLGENGSGKSTLLRALALAFADHELATSLLLQKEYPWCSLDSEGKAAGRATIRVQTPQTELVRYIVSHGERESLEPLKTNSENAAQLPWLWAYGCRRGSALGGPDRAVQFGALASVSTLFEDSKHLVNAETWLKDRALAAEQNKTGIEYHIYRYVLDTLCEVLDVKEIKIQDRKVWLKGTGVGYVPLSALSDGYISMTGWVIDLMARWIERMEAEKRIITSNFPEQMRGLVLIDEIDLFLHPRWQCRVIADIRKRFKHLSFVATTHNPLSLLGAEPKEIYVLRPREVERQGKTERNIEAFQVDLPKGIRADQVLTGPWFGLESTLDADTLKLIERHRALLRRSDAEALAERAKVEEELRNRMGSFADTAVERLALSVAAELMEEERKASGELTNEDRERIRERMKRITKERIAAGRF